MNKDIDDKQLNAHSFMISRPQSKLSFKRFSIDKVKSIEQGASKRDLDSNKDGQQMNDWNNDEDLNGLTRRVRPSMIQMPTL